MHIRSATRPAPRLGPSGCRFCKPETQGTTLGGIAAETGGMVRSRLALSTSSPFARTDAVKCRHRARSATMSRACKICWISKPHFSARRSRLRRHSGAAPRARSRTTCKANHSTLRPWRRPRPGPAISQSPWSRRSPPTSPRPTPMPRAMCTGAPPART